jgi:hypothetical protein
MGLTLSQDDNTVMNHVLALDFHQGVRRLHMHFAGLASQFKAQATARPAFHKEGGLSPR